MKAALAAACALALAGCQEKKVVERFAGVRLIVPAWQDRTALGASSSGLLERRDRQGAVVNLKWDPDERHGVPGEAEALLAAAPGAGAKTSVTVALERVDGHPATLVESGGGTLVWRCDKTGRLLRLSVNEQALAQVSLASLAAGVACHVPGDKPVNGEVPVADAALLGEGWHFARRQPASAAWLHDDAVLTLFSGTHTQSPREPEVAIKLAAGWTAAAGLTRPTGLAAERAEGPQHHQVLRVTGRALLDGAPVRFTLLQWRCIAKGKSFAALVFTKDAAVPAATAASGKAWTPFDAALNAVRCHG